MTIEHGGDVWRQGPPEAWLDFSANLNPDGPPGWVREAMLEGVRRARYYPDMRMKSALRGLSAHLGLDGACVLPTAGGIEAAALAARLPLPGGGRPRHVIFQPTFGEYVRLCEGMGDAVLQPALEVCARLCDDMGETDHRSPVGTALMPSGASVPPVPACRPGDIHADTINGVPAEGGPREAAGAAICDYDPAPGDRLWVCNPNNPTGGALSRAQLEALLEKVEAVGAQLIVDEAFIDYCPEHSVRDLAADHPALMVLGSLTKVLAIPGARLGYLAAHPDVIRAIRRGDGAGTLLPWRLNCLADAVASALPGHEGDFEAIRRLNRTRRAAFAQALEALGLRLYPSQANFLLADLGRDARPVIDAVHKRGVLVRSCDGFAGLGRSHVRLCVRREDENARLIAALREEMGPAAYP